MPPSVVVVTPQGVNNSLTNFLDSPSTGPGYNQAPGNCILVFANDYSVAMPATPTDLAGNTFTPVFGTAISGQNSGAIQAWIAPNCLGYTGNELTLTWGSNILYGTLWYLDISGIVLSSPLDFMNHVTQASGTATTISDSVTTTHPVEVSVSFFVQSAAGLTSATQPSGYGWPNFQIQSAYSALAYDILSSTLSGSTTQWSYAAASASDMVTISLIGVSSPTGTVVLEDYNAMFIQQSQTYIVSRW